MKIVKVISVKIDNIYEYQIYKNLCNLFNILKYTIALS